MKNQKFLKRTISLAVVFVLILSFIPLPLVNNVGAVFADDGENPVEEPAAEPAQEAAPEAPAAEETAPEPATEEEAPAEEEVAEEPAEEAAADEPAEEEVAEAAAEEAAAEEVAAEEAVEEVLAEPAEEEAAVEEENLADVVEALSENDVQIVDESGEPIAMASEEAAEILSSTDPFFWDGSQWVGYAYPGDPCPTNVNICNPTSTPFRDAVDNAPTGSTIYVAQGDYAEDVVVDTPNLSFSAFYSIEVSASSPTPTNIIGGYATVDQITLNVDFGSTSGVYADLVTVNEPGKTGGRLDDAMELASYDGRIEADMEIYSHIDPVLGNHYRVRDVNHHEINFEWECGEPNEVIYPNNKTYRMTLMRPIDPTIEEYYNTLGDEERSAGLYLNSKAPDNPYLDLSATERIEDLRIAVNVSESYEYWKNSDEERIYWYLLGQVGKDNSGRDNNNKLIKLSDPQQLAANKITGKNDAGDLDNVEGTEWDDVTHFWDVWFMWPETETKNSNQKTVDVSPEDRQLTFFVYDPRDFGHDGCMDPEALNYDPNATYQDNAICEYPIDPPTTTTTTTPGGGVFLAAAEELIIPVTGADLGVQAIAPASGLLLVGISFLMKGWMEKKKK